MVRARLWCPFFLAEALSVGGDGEERDGAHGQVVGQFVGCADRAADQQLVGIGPGVDQQPVMEAMALAAG